MAMRGKDKSGEMNAGAPYRRRSRPVPVSGGLPDWRSLPWRRIVIGAATTAAVLTALWGGGAYLNGSDRFTLQARGVAASGLQRLDESSVTEIFAADVGRSLFAVPLAERRRAILDQPWVRTASVARVWPDQLWIDVEERKPVAYVRTGQRKEGVARLIDADGVLLDPLEGAAFSLPVLDGVEQDEPIEERRPRVRLFEALMADLDSAEPRYGEHVSQVDVADLENAKVTVVHEGDSIELEMGDELFRHRYEIFLKYVVGWKRQFGALGRVDLRYEDQVVVLPLSASGRSGK